MNKARVFVYKEELCEMSYKGITNAHREGNARYDKEKIDSVHLRLKKGEKDHYKAAADKAGMSLNQFFVTAADEKIERDNLDSIPK